MATVALIPAYEPDEKLVKLAAELQGHYFDVLIINDGSGPEYDDIFERCREYATVEGYSENRGKGAALKYGMNVIRNSYPDTKHFITADADGQHSIHDICKVRDELIAEKDFVLSVRRLRRDAPLKSRIGNGITKFLLTIANAHYLPDNQSGLRGFSTRHLDWMLEVPGDKYDYELNVIMLAEKQAIKITRLPIEAIYFDNNSGSHFKPVADTLKLYKIYAKTNVFLIIAWLINIALVTASTIVWGYSYFQYVIIATWAVYALLCFVVERYTIFRHIHYTPGARRLIISIFKFTVYGLFCWGTSFSFIPFIVAYLFIAIAVAFGEYYMLKVAYD